MTMRWREALVPNGEWILALALVAEIARLRGRSRSNFFTVANFFEITRLSVELGLLAVALTPVIVSGGIDLSVGAMMGLSAVVFGAAVARLAHCRCRSRPRLALRGGLRRRRAECAAHRRGSTIPPLIVTLGSLSLFRGIAEGLTRGAVNYTDFPRVVPRARPGLSRGASFPRSCRSSSWSSRPTSCCCTARSIGRALYAIGFTRGRRALRRHSGRAARRRSSTCCPGSMASVAAIIYVAHLGQARSDAGTGYELDAITAVVLGGTSVFGGRGTLWGTLLGLFALVGAAQRPAARRAAVGAGRRADRHAAARRRSRSIAARMRARPPTRGVAAGGDGREEQSGCRAVRRHRRGIADRRRHERLAGALARAAAAPSQPAAAPRRRPAARSARSIAMMPKAKGDPYFISCRAGAEEAARELGVDLIWDGPTEPRRGAPERAGRELDHPRVDVIAVAVENRGGISSVLRKARERGIKVLTWDADAEPDARDFFVNQATPEGIANTLTDEAARLLGGKRRVRDHHRRAERREPERVDRVHQEAAGREVSGPEARDDPPERRRPRQGVRRDADDHARLSGGQAGDGDLGAGGAGLGRSRAAGGRART